MSVESCRSLNHFLLVQHHDKEVEQVGYFAYAQARFYECFRVELVVEYGEYEVNLYQADYHWGQGQLAE